MYYIIINPVHEQDLKQLCGEYSKSVDKSRGTDCCAISGGTTCDYVFCFWEYRKQKHTVFTFMCV